MQFLRPAWAARLLCFLCVLLGGLLGGVPVVRAQKAEVPAHITLKSGVAFDAPLVLTTNLFRRKEIDERSINNKTITVVDSATERDKKIRTDLVQEIRFTDPRGAERTFISAEGTLHELMWDGKIKWLRYFGSMPNGANPVPESYWIGEDGTVYTFKPLANWRKLMKRAMASRSDLWPEIDRMSWSYGNIRKLLQQYDAG